MVTNIFYNYWNGHHSNRLGFKPAFVNLYTKFGYKSSSTPYF